MPARSASKKKKPRSILSKADAIGRIDQMVPMIIQEIESAMVLEAALEVGNETVQKLRGEGQALNLYGAHCHVAIRLGLTVSLALTIAKLFDPAKLFDRPKKSKPTRPRRSANLSDIASIPLLIRLLKQARCRSTMGERARKWTPELEGMEYDNEKTALAALDAAIDAYNDFRRSNEGRRAAAVLKSFRNKHLGHSLVDQTMKPLPRFKDLTLLFEVAMKVAAEIKLGVLGHPWDIEDARDERRRQSAAFWEPALKGVIMAESR